mmetsp:Transcript_54024/g.135824  ORF Transcript_54024/g.135824 Transcript_54024/m.135824 type:complete len:218 (+) Transcript_54024:558-1211(+)
MCPTPTRRGVCPRLRWTFSSRCSRSPPTNPKLRCRMRRGCRAGRTTVRATTARTPPAATNTTAALPTASVTIRRRCCTSTLSTTEGSEVWVSRCWRSRTSRSKSRHCSSMLAQTRIRRPFPSSCTTCSSSSTTHTTSTAHAPTLSADAATGVWCRAPVRATTRTRVPAVSTTRAAAGVSMRSSTRLSPQVRLWCPARTAMASLSSRCRLRTNTSWCP